MKVLIRSRGVALVGLIAAVGLSACGGGGQQSAVNAAGSAQRSGPDPTAPSAGAAAKAMQSAKKLSGGIVATVAGQPITLASYQQAYNAQSKAMASGPVPLDPPSFSHCAAAMAQQFSKLQQQVAKAKIKNSRAPSLPTPSHDALVKQCQSRQSGIKTSVMTQLIQQRWLADEAKAQGVTISDSTVQVALSREQRAMGGAAGYAKYLARVGQTQEQAMGNVRLMLTEQAVQQKRLGPPVTVTDQQVQAYFNAHQAEFKLPHQPDPKLSTYAPRIRLLLQQQARAQRSAGATTGFERHWRAQTICAPAYVVPLCANAPR